MARRATEAETNRADVLGQRTESWRPMSLLQKVAGVFGGVFALIGILGFIPGITTGFDDLGLAGPDSQAFLFGVFQVSVLHNVVHLLFGLVGLGAATGAVASRWFLLGGGGLYAVLWIYGLLVDENSDANFVPVNDADDWLHLVLAIGMIGLGSTLRAQPR